MDFDKILDDCVTLENTITVLIKNNANQEAKLAGLQTLFLEEIQVDIHQLVEREHELNKNLDILKLTKEEYESDIKQFTEINGRLAELVVSAQKFKNEKVSNEDKLNDTYLDIAAIIQEYEQLKIDFVKLAEDISLLNEGLERDADAVKQLVKHGRELVINLHKNDNAIRVLDQQNKFAEQQFDLILNQLPWEPLNDSYLDSLCRTDDTNIRELASAIKIQTDEINELNDSLTAKKRRKLTILEQLASQLNEFVRKRSESLLMDGKMPDSIYPKYEQN